MTKVAESIFPVNIDAEWQRIDILTRCLIASRSGKQPDQQLINELNHKQNQVNHLRTAVLNPWKQIAPDLSALAMDVLACVYVVEVYPRIGWLYQELQPNSGQPFVCMALIQMLLALDDCEVIHLKSLIAPEGELVKCRLVEVNEDSAFAAIRPAKGMLSKLLNLPEPDTAPPGSIKVTIKSCWNDLVLPSDREMMLREFMLWLKHRDRVVNEWGGHSLGGPVALFSGPSGTGKTFAASVIANELGWPLYRVDLARLVSKYIGETEKNIGHLFDAAHGKKMVLQFDEVDALMSKRGEIKEARDRYANMEVSYLLSRIEDHLGPCILTTNMRNQIDKAFTRRFQVVVEFPRPDVSSRIKLWQRMFPPRAPLSDDIDTALLGKSANLTGGNIRNAALHSAYLAAEDDSAIDLPHVAIAIWRELSKERIQVTRTDLGMLAEYLPDSVFEK